MKNKVNDNDIDMAYNKSRNKKQYSELPHVQVGKSDTPKETMTRLDMKVMKQRRGLGYEQLEKVTLGKLETNLKGAMKKRGSKFEDVPRHLGRDHAY